MSSGHLLNGLVAACVFTGADQYSKLETMSDGKVTPTNIYETECQPKVLGLFDSVSTVLPFYPPTGPLGQFSELSLDTSKLSHSTSGLPSGMINSLCVFIYPDGFYVWGSQYTLSQPSLSLIILTDIEGVRHYCVNATFWRRFVARKCTDADQLTYELSLSSDSQQKADTSIEISVPLNVTLVSRVPLFQTMKCCLSSLLEDLATSSDLYSVLHRFNSMLFHIPSPPPGSLALHFTLNNHFIMLRGLSQDYPHCDSHLFWPFFSLTTDDVLRVFGYILTQQNVVFTSNNYNLLALTMQCFCHYLFPFEWRLTFAPLLPKRLLAILDSPTTFLCGCHTFSMKEVDKEELNNIIFVCLDRGVITCTDDLTLDQPHLSFPSYFIQKYNQSINSLFKHRCHSFHTMDEATSGNLLREKTQRVEWEAEMDHKLIDLIMNLVSDVFQDVSTYVTYPSEFNSEGFLRIINQEFKPFYQAVLETDVFNQMLKQLLNKLKTPFTKSLDDIRKRKQSTDSTAPDLLDPMSSFICISTSDRGILTEYVSLENSVAGNNIFVSTQQSKALLSTLELPPFPDGGADSNAEYFKSCIERINSHLSNSSLCRAEHIYLRGYYLLALGDPLKAMEDFLSHLSKINVNLVPPEQNLVEIYSRLSEDYKEALRKMPYFSRSVFEMEHEISLSRRLSHAKFPIQTMTRDEFELHLQTNGISANSETCSILFSVLTNGGTIIIPDTLKKFSECWCLVKKINLSLQHSSIKEFPTKEQILFCTCDKPLSQLTQHSPQPTHLVKYHNMQGHLLITEQNAWLLLLDNKLVHLFRFSQVSAFGFVETKDRHFQKLSHPYGIKILPTTEIEDLKSVAKINLDKICRKPIYHSIRFYDNRMCVFVIECFRELHAAHALVQRRKDEAYFGEGKLNVLLLATLLRMSANTLNRDGANDLFSQAIKQGLFYLFKTQMGCREVESNCLLYRFNPLSTDTQKASIEVLLPISNKLVQNQIFWVGYVYQRESIICVYDFHARAVVSDFILHDQRVEAIVEVGPKVWLSSLNKCLYIVDKESHTIDGRLSEPNDVAVAFHYDALQGEVWVLYHKGQIVVWDTRSLEQKRIIQLQTKTQEPTRYSSMVILQNYIFAQSPRSLLVYEKDLGEFLRSLPLESPHNNDKLIEGRSLCVSAKGHVWVAGIREPIIFVFDPLKLKLIKAIDVNKKDSIIQCNGFNSILSVSNSIWLGGRNGYIYIYDDEEFTLSSFFKAHEDSIRCLSVTRSQSIVTSGSNSKDGRVSFWST